MKQVTALALVLAVTAGVFVAQAQQSIASSTAKSPKRKAVPRTDPAVAAQLDELKQAMDTEQQQIRQLRDRIQNRDQQIQQLQRKLNESQAAAAQARSKGENATAQAAEEQQAVTTLKNDVTDLKASNTNAALILQETQKAISDLESPWQFATRVSR